MHNTLQNNEKHSKRTKDSPRFCLRHFIWMTKIHTVHIFVHLFPFKCEENSLILFKSHPIKAIFYDSHSVWMSFDLDRDGFGLVWQCQCSWGDNDTGITFQFGCNQHTKRKWFENKILVWLRTRNGKWAGFFAQVFFNSST